MRYWWVNQKQTFRQELAGGFMWSPKMNANGGNNPYYNFMTEVVPGDCLGMLTPGIAFALAAELFQEGAESARKLALKTATDIEQQLATY